jgi:hypothetical protein
LRRTATKRSPKFPQLAIALNQWPRIHIHHCLLVEAQAT